LWSPQPEEKREERGASLTTTTTNKTNKNKQTKKQKNKTKQNKTKQNKKNKHIHLYHYHSQIHKSHESKLARCTQNFFLYLSTALKTIYVHVLMGFKSMCTLRHADLQQFKLSMYMCSRVLRACVH